MNDLFGWEPPKKKPPPRKSKADRLAEAKAAKKEAMERVEANADRAWYHLMLELVRQICVDRPRFTTDEAFERYDAIEGDKPATHETKAMGPVMLRAAKLGYCRKTNTTENSNRKSCHNRPLAIWESLIHVRH
jgi:hypothetical protein